MFRRGLELKHEVAGALATDYHSALVDRVRASDNQWQAGRLQVHLAAEFGFCYGVDRAVDYAYQTRRKFPERPIFLTGEIIHNPRVNNRLRSAGIRFLSDPDENEEALGAEDVVILPAFGVTIGMLERFQRLEKCPPICPRWLYRYHPWQGQARGDASHCFTSSKIPERTLASGPRSSRSRSRV